MAGGRNEALECFPLHSQRGEGFPSLPWVGVGVGAALGRSQWDLGWEELIHGWVSAAELECGR